MMNALRLMLNEKQNKCKICGNLEKNRYHIAREMMFGYRDEFLYMECGSCGVLQLINVPESIEKYYPSNYYSFFPQNKYSILVRQIYSALTYKNGLLGDIIMNICSKNDAILSLKRLKIKENQRILDIGCGSGQLLLMLKFLGFDDIMGIDPYIKKDILYSNGVKICKKELEEVKDIFDIIMLHHVFEHMDQPQKIMNNLSRILSPNGRIIIRLPIASSYAWHHYGVNWMHMDPPRHFYLYTLKSIEILCRNACMHIEKIIYESNESQFIGSEQNVKNIPIINPRSYFYYPFPQFLKFFFIHHYLVYANQLNNKENGDLVCFYLRKNKNSN